MGNFTSSQGRSVRGEYDRDRFGGQVHGPFGGQQQVPQQYVGPQQSAVGQQPYINNPGYRGGPPPMTSYLPAYGQPPQGFEQQQAYQPYPQQGYPYYGYPQQGYPQQGYQQSTGLGNAAGCAACMACLTCLLCSCCQGMMNTGIHGIHGMDDMNADHGITQVTPPQTDAIDADDN